MGVLDYFTASSPDDKRREEVRTGAVAPDRSERKRCWEARDKYFACLDRHDVIDPVTGEGKAVADKNCAAEDAVFGQDCATAWVAYFKKFRVAEYQKKKTLERLQREGANNMGADSAIKR